MSKNSKKEEKPVELECSGCGSKTQPLTENHGSLLCDECWDVYADESSPEVPESAKTTDIEELADALVTTEKQIVLYAEALELRKTRDISGLYRLTQKRRGILAALS